MPTQRRTDQLRIDRDRACAQAMHEGIHSHIKKLAEKIGADALASIERAEQPRQLELALTQEHPMI